MLYCINAFKYFVSGTPGIPGSSGSYNKPINVYPVTPGKNFLRNYINLMLM